jgi:HK97 family phage portal protein
MKWTQRLSAAIKAFRLGPAVVEPADKIWGKDPETFSPPAYGDYIATSSAVYACATLRAKNVASLPLRAYRMVDGEQVEVTDGAFVDLMKTVNPHWTYNRLMQMTELSLCLWGQAFWVLERGPRGEGVPKEIWWARPDRMRLIPDAQNYIAGWIYDWNNERLTFTPDEVIWFRYPNPLDEFSGLSPIAATRLAIDTASGALMSNHAIFKNGLQIAGVVSPQDKDTTWSRDQVEFLRESLERRFKGADKAHRLAVLGQSTSFQPIGVSPKDAQFIELMKWTRSDVASVMAVPPELIGDHEHATYSNIEQAYKGLWSDCLLPEASMLADDITEQLCKLFGDEVDFVEFDHAHISALQPDRLALVEQATKWVAMGVPLNKVLSEIAPQFLPDGGGYAWGDAPLALPAPQPQTQDNTRGAGVPLKKNGSMTRPSGYIEFGSPEHVAVWKAYDRKARGLENAFRAALEEVMREQAETLADLVRLSGEKSYSVKASRDDYDGIDWTPSGAVRRAFREGIYLYEQGRGGDGLVASTLSWARRLADGESITPEKAIKMNAWHARHASDKRPGWDEEGAETPGYVAFLLWGGEPGQEWAARIVKKMREQDESDNDTKALTPDDLDDLWDEDYWQTVFADRLLDQMQNAAEAGGTDALRQLRIETDFNLNTPDGNRYLLERTQRFAEQVNDTTWQQLRTSLADGIDAGLSIEELADVVSQTMDLRINQSAETIARTEVIGALNGGAILGAQQSGVPAKKTWIAALDQRTRDTHIDAHETYQANPIDLNDEFLVGGGAGLAPGQIGLPEEDINCRCTVGWSVDLDALEADASRSVDLAALARLKQFAEGE